MKARSAIALGLLATGCSGLFDSGHKPIALCQSDSDCGHDQVCFVDGCGDPGKDIAVEVTPSASNGPYAQDFAVDSIEANQTLQLFPPSAVTGSLVRNQNLGAPLPYTSPVTIVANGESQIIPGLFRHYEATLAPLGGTYRLPVGSGVYSVAAIASDPTLPPLFASVEVAAGHDGEFDLTFPKPADLIVFGATVVDSAGGVPAPPRQVEAVDENGRALSQQVALDASGGFTVTVSSSVLDTHELHLKVTPVDSLAVVPEADFTVDLTQPPATLQLSPESAPIALQGRLVATDGTPVGGASVHVEGSVPGGFFRSQTVHSSDAGTFELQTLAGDGLQLLAVPPAGALAGLVQEPIALDGGSLADVVAPNRIEVSGTVQSPDGALSSGVIVVAEPVAALDEQHPLPPAGGQTTTDAQARFTLPLDPGQYRLDLIPSDKLARTSRYVSVDPSAGPAVTLSPFVLSRGRSVNGHVEILSADGGAVQSAPLARVRFYRRIEVDGGTGSVLLDQTYADESGNYTVLLPTR